MAYIDPPRASRHDVLAAQRELALRIEPSVDESTWRLVDASGLDANAA